MHKNKYAIILSRDCENLLFRLLNQLFLPLKITVFHYCLIKIFIVILTTPQNISYNIKQ